jgi:hypothetical protein
LHPKENILLGSQPPISSSVFEEHEICPLEKETCHNSILLIGSNISEILLVSKQGGISIERGQPQYLFPSKLNS